MGASQNQRTQGSPLETASFDEMRLQSAVCRRQVRVQVVAVERGVEAAIGELGRVLERHRVDEHADLVRSVEIGACTELEPQLVHERLVKLVLSALEGG